MCTGRQYTGVILDRPLFTLPVDRAVYIICNLCTQVVLKVAVNRVSMLTGCVKQHLVIRTTLFANTAHEHGCHFGHPYSRPMFNGDASDARKHG